MLKLLLYVFMNACLVLVADILLLLSLPSFPTEILSKDLIFLIHCFQRSPRLLRMLVWPLRLSQKRMVSYFTFYCEKILILLSHIFLFPHLSWHTQCYNFLSFSLFIHPFIFFSIQSFTLMFANSNVFLSFLHTLLLFYRWSFCISIRFFAFISFQIFFCAFSIYFLYPRLCLPEMCAYRLVAFEDNTGIKIIMDAYK